MNNYYNPDIQLLCMNDTISKWMSFMNLLFIGGCAEAEKGSF